MDTTADTKWKKTERRMEIGFVGLVILILVVILMVTSSNLQTKSSAQEPVKVARFSGSVVYVSLVNPHSVNVKFSIKNHSQTPGVPNCTITIQDPSGAFPSFSAPIITDSILAGHSRFSKMYVSIAGPGPQYVTQGKIHCD